MFKDCPKCGGTFDMIEDYDDYGNKARQEWCCLNCRIFIAYFPRGRK